MGAEIYLIRNGHSLVRGLTPALSEEARKESSPLSDMGERQAVAAGLWLRHVVAQPDVRGFLYAPGYRSKTMALRVAGQTDWSVSQQPEGMLAHRDLSLEEVRERARGWLITQRESGVYIAVMSGRAIRAALQTELKFSDDQADKEPDLWTGPITPGSIVSLEVSEQKIEIRSILCGLGTADDIKQHAA